MYPGETFQVPVAVVGHRYGLVPTTVRNVILNYHAGNLPDHQHLQYTNNAQQCKLHIVSMPQSVDIELYAERSPKFDKSIHYNVLFL